MTPQRIDQALFAEFFVRVVERLGDSVGIDRQDVPRAEGSFLYQAIPVAERAQYRCRGLETVERVAAPQEERGQVAAVGVSRASPPVIIFGKKQSSVGALNGVLGGTRG